MDNHQYISITEFCNCHHIEVSFISELSEYGLLNLVVIDNNEFLEKEQIAEVEKLMRLHYDLEINIAGIDAINNLLSRVSQLQNEIRLLENKIRRYES